MLLMHRWRVPIAAEAAPATRLWLCAQERAALPTGSPCGPASGWRISPKGRAHDARAFVAGHGWTVNEPRHPIAQSTGRTPVDRAAGVPFSLVTFSWARKRKLPARRKRAENTRMWVGHCEKFEPAARNANSDRTAKAPSPCPLPQAGEAKAKGMRDEPNPGNNKARKPGPRRAIRIPANVN